MFLEFMMAIKTMNVRLKRDIIWKIHTTPFNFTRSQQIMDIQLIIILVNLRCQIVIDVTRFPNGILHNNGNVWAHGQNHSGSQTRRLGEEVEVPKRESQFHGLLHVNHHLIFVLLRSVVLTNQHIASTKIASYVEFDPLLRAADGEGVTKDLHVTNNTLEFSRRHLNGALIFGVGNAKLLAVDVHEFEFYCSSKVCRQ